MGGQWVFQLISTDSWKSWRQQGPQQAMTLVGLEGQTINGTHSLPRPPSGALGTAPGSDDAESNEAVASDAVSTHPAAATWPAALAAAAADAAAAAAAGQVAPAPVQAEGQEPIRLTAAAVQSWYTKAASAYERYGVEPPVYPGQCVPCPEGSVQSGAACRCCIGGSAVLGLWEGGLGGNNETMRQCKQKPHGAQFRCLVAVGRGVVVRVKGWVLLVVKRQSGAVCECCVWAGRVAGNKGEQW